ncbi:MAG: hypothetical protein Ct9H300mP14_14290 [Gammaproteobacteria bacterium]|nr:MAG: hypothetical protein Ct9H300mP14_14290 [Gammaproteobacteria bacterium]
MKRGKAACIYRYFRENVLHRYIDGGLGRAQPSSSAPDREGWSEKNQNVHRSDQLLNLEQWQAVRFHTITVYVGREAVNSVRDCCDDFAHVLFGADLEFLDSGFDNFCTIPIQ